MLKLPINVLNELCNGLKDIYYLGEVLLCFYEDRLELISIGEKINYIWKYKKSFTSIYVYLGSVNVENEYYSINICGFAWDGNKNSYEEVIARNIKGHDLYLVQYNEYDDFVNEQRVACEENVYWYQFAFVQCDDSDKSILGKVLDFIHQPIVKTYTLDYCSNFRDTTVFVLMTDIYKYVIPLKQYSHKVEFLTVIC